MSVSLQKYSAMLFKNVCTSVNLCMSDCLGNAISNVKCAFTIN
jgi:hypothetical protein